MYGTHSGHFLDENKAFVDTQKIGVCHTVDFLVWRVGDELPTSEAIRSFEFNHIGTVTLCD
jgi:hypothetical protein